MKTSNDKGMNNKTLRIALYGFLALFLISNTTAYWDTPTITLNQLNTQYCQIGGNCSFNILNVTTHNVNETNSTGNISMNGNDILMGNGEIKDILHLHFNITNCISGDESSGTLCYNTEDDTLEIYTNSSQTIQIGRELSGLGKNTEGRTLPDGTVVALYGYSGDKRLFISADSTNITKSSLVGVLTTECVNNAICPVTVFGDVRDIDTTAWSSGDKLYINPNEPGNLTNIKPTLPNNPVWVATAGVIHANTGTLFAFPNIDPSDGFLAQNGWFSGNLTIMEKVGIGTANPTEALDIVGNIQMTGTTETRIKMENTNSKWDILSDATPNNFRILHNTTTVPFQIEAEAITGALYVANDDRVGINTISPVASLHIVQPTGSNTLLRMANTLQSQNWDMFISGGALFIESPTLERDIYFRDLGNTITMVIDNSENDVNFPNGDVGIGTSSPTKLLHLESATNGGARIKLKETGTGGNNNPGIQFDNEGTFKGGMFYNEFLDTIELWYDSGSAISIDTTGKVSINGGLTIENYERHIQIPILLTGNPSTQPDTVNNGAVSGVSFSSTTDQCVFMQWEVPDDWVNGTNVTVELDTYPDGGDITGSDLIEWDVEYVAVAEGELLNKTPTTQTEYESNVSQWEFYHQQIILNNGFEKQDHIFFEICRDVSNGDDYSGTIIGTGFEVLYQSNSLPTSN